MPPTQRPPHHSITPATGHTAIVTGPSRPRTPKVQEALDARDALAGALSQAGVQLPAMDVRTPWAGDGEDGAATRSSTSGSARRPWRCSWRL